MTSFLALRASVCVSNSPGMLFLFSGSHHLQHYEDNSVPSSSARHVLYATQTFFKRMLRAGFAMAQSCSSTSYHILIAVQVCSIVTNRIFFSA